ncbi:MAG: winged helix-turn-helix transcriptional regulator [Rhizobiaceae bacterium]|nr:winged helix-turn-helix transcriptional regulator [Rhizobiaceae bacterium]
MLREMERGNHHHLPSLDGLHGQSIEVASLLKALAHPVRLQLATKLAEGEYSVGALENMIGVHQPSLSQQLGVLRTAGIVDTRRESKQIFYRLSDERAASLIQSLANIFVVLE